MASLLHNTTKHATLAGRAGHLRTKRCSRKGWCVMSASAKPTVMINSVTGRMGTAVAQAALRAGLSLVPFSLTGEAEARDLKTASVEGQQVELVGPSNRDTVLTDLKLKYPGFITVDYSIPDVVNANASLYIKHALPFVMGTTGGDREKLLSDVSQAGLYAVIAPQMGKQVVAFQATLETMAQTFPGAFSGFDLKVLESHQAAKKDVSGTAKAIVASFLKLGAKFNMDDIQMVRDPEEQVSKMGVPRDYISGHAFHTYQLVSPDGTVQFEFKHNVCGRSIYAEGTVDAVLFLAQQIEKGADQTLYNMIDVLKAGAMR